MKAEILNLDIIIPPKRFIYITERAKGPAIMNRFLPAFLQSRSNQIKIDVSSTSTRISLEIEQSLERYVTAVEEKRFNDVEEECYDIIIAMCKPSFPAITRDWIKENTNPDQIIAWFNFLLKPLQERGAKSKNAAAARVPKK